MGHGALDTVPDDPRLLARAFGALYWPAQRLSILRVCPTLGVLRFGR
jgi:hypothetical protein